MGEGTEAGEGERSTIEGQDKESLSRDSGQMTPAEPMLPAEGRTRTEILSQERVLHIAETNMVDLRKGGV